MNSVSIAVRPVERPQMVLVVRASSASAACLHVCQRAILGDFGS